MKIRAAKSSDKEKILSFCVNTFSWGDYIDRVWDYWYRTGRLYVVEDKGRSIAMSHVVMCPGTKTVWLEGVRVHPDYRRSKIGTRLLEKMIEYGRKKRAVRASAIVDVTNIPSQRMLERNGFKVISRWAYYVTDKKPAKITKKSSAVRIATADDINDIWKYLGKSKIYQLSARTYVKSWHWYPLDRKTLRDLVKEKSVMVAGSPISGITIINRHGYWDKKKIIQIVYLDSKSKAALKQLFSLATSIYANNGFEQLQIVCYDSRRLTSYIEKHMTKDEEQFLLYSKVFTAKDSRSR
ncbi:MAG TPA: GNAT family N-acetyltransferase [Nitrososphaera sp.]|nr:GNAT family N-acetyltransferase [Nitrososphaera sp.]